MASSIQQAIAIATIATMVAVIADGRGATQLQCVGIAVVIVVVWALGYSGGLTKRLE